MIRKTFWHNIAYDLRFALKAMRQHPGFSAGIVLTVAFGIGVNTAMFSIIRAVLLKPLAYPEPDRLALATEGATPERAREIAEASRSFTEVGAFAVGLEDVALSGSGEPEQLKGARVSANFLHILGVGPLAGRSFSSAENQPGAAPVAMISAELWRRRFGRNPAIVGQSVSLAGVPTTIVGVLPASFQFPMVGADVWLPRPAEWSVLAPKSRSVSPFLTVFGRLKDGVGIKQATAELTILDRQYAATHPNMLDAKPNSPDILIPLKENLISDVRPKLWMLFGAVGFVLLIVCANIGGLLLTRAASRAREFAVRAAIGAGRGRIIGQLLAESTLLAFAGGILGTTLAVASLRGIRSVAFLDLPRSSEVGVDAIVLAFGVALSLAAGIAFGVMPALAASTPDLAGVLRGSGEGAGLTRTNSLFGSRSILVVGQVALSTVLLIGAALLIESLGRIYHVDPGFEPSNVLTLNLTLTPARYNTIAMQAAFYERLVEQSGQLPGVRGAALATTLPMSDNWMGTTLELPAKADVRMSERPIAVIESITPGYFRTLAIPIKRGRDFSTRDNPDSAPVAIINETAARIFWPQYPGGADPVGQQILIGDDTRATEIIGVSADVHQTGKDMDPRPAVYLPCLQKPQTSAMLAVRTDGNPLGLAGAVRAQVLQIDPDQPVYGISTLEDIVDASEGELRLITRLLGAFAGLATILAVFGLYGVVSYSVLQRTKEIGIRRALGAPTGNVVGLVARQTLSLALAGVVLGAGGALLLTRLMKDLLFQVSATDPATFVGISILFVSVALVASYVPVRRAIGIDPMEALRI